MKKLLFITHSLNNTGAPLVLKEMAIVCLKMENAVDIIGMEDGPLREEFEALGFKVEIADDFLDNLKKWQDRFYSYDAVIVNTLAAIEAVFALNTTTVPTIWWIHEHEYWFIYYQSIFPKSGELRENIHVYGVSEVTNKYIKEYCGIEPGLLSFGIKDQAADYTLTTPAKEDKTTFVLPGTISEVKGQDILCEAILRLPKKVRDKCKFIIFGKRNDGEKQFSELIESYGSSIEQLTVLEGMSHEDTLKLIAEADYLVAPSRVEPFSATTVEALMLSKIPIISDVCGVLHYLEDGRDCLVFKTEDIDELVKAIKRAVQIHGESIGEYSLICKNARKRYEECFSTEVFANNVRTALQNTIQGDGMKSFNTIIVITPADCQRLIKLYPRLIESITYGKVSFVGTKGVFDCINSDEELSGKAGFIDENSIIPFDDVHACMAKKMEKILAGRELPRGITGWYYQQFLKMQYAFVCQDEYYMVWDGDTIPCKQIKMFQDESGKPYLDMKHEYHEEYFETMGKLLPGIRKVIERSFISEHMLIRADIMRELVTAIENNDKISGEKFWEKIINAIPAEKIQDSAFSEFETYGTFCALRHMSVYILREWHSFRQGGTFFNINKISDRDFNWLSKDFDAISFEKGHDVRKDNANLFDNPYYQERLTPKQMLQAAQLEFKEGYKEVWGEDQGATSNVSSGAFADAQDDIEIGDRLKYLSRDTYKIYDEMGDKLVDTNIDQAYLCYENAEYLCDDEAVRMELFAKKMKLMDSGRVQVKKTAFVILSYNNTYLMQRCLESIYTNCNPDSYQLIVFDNGSTDGVAKWLAKFGEEHEEAYIVLSEENLGFSGGCNEGFKYAEDDYDVFFLNNDVRVPANALFWLRMALYESEEIGGVGAVQNYFRDSREENVEFSVIEQYMEYGAKKNVPAVNPYEEKSKLCGFAMLFKRKAYDATTGFDERFNPGYFEDDDISLQVRTAGYKLIMTHNSFIYHAGTQSFRERKDVQDLSLAHRKILIEKWGFDSSVYASTSENEMTFIDSLEKKGYTKESEFSVLHIGCGCANMLGHIHYLYPKCEVVGVEENDSARKYAISCVSVYKRIEDLPRKKEEYDEVADHIG